MLRFVLILAAVWGMMAGAVLGQPEVEWARVYQQQQAQWVGGIAELPSGDIVLCGTNARLWWDEYVGYVYVCTPLLIRLDKNGDPIWSHLASGDWEPYGRGGQNNYCLLLPDSTLIVSATILRSISSSVISKMSQDGDTIAMQERFGQGSGSLGRIAKTADDNIVVVGSTQTDNVNIRYFGWLLKLDPSCGRIWESTFDNEYYCYFADVVTTRDGGFGLAGGMSPSADDETDFWLVRAGVHGDEIWSRNYGFDGQDRCGNIVATRDGGFVLAGYATHLNPFTRQAWILRVDRDGEELWSRFYGEAGANEATGLLATDDGGCIACGNGDSLGWMIRLDPQGEVLWEFTFGSENGYVTFRDIIETSDGGILLGGSVSGHSLEDGFDIILVKTSPDPVSAPSDQFILHPSSLILNMPYPNPFNSATVSNYQLPVSSFVRMGLFDMRGRMVQSLADGWMQAGEHRMLVNAANLPAGEYLIKLTAGDAMATQKIALVK